MARRGKPRKLKTRRASLPIGRVFDEGSAQATEACSPKSRSYVVFYASVYHWPIESHSLAQRRHRWRHAHPHGALWLGIEKPSKCTMAPKMGTRAFFSYVAQVMRARMACALLEAHAAIAERLHAHCLDSRRRAEHSQGHVSHPRCSWFLEMEASMHPCDRQVSF